MKKLTREGPAELATRATTPSGEGVTSTLRPD